MKKSNSAVPAASLKPALVKPVAAATLAKDKAKAVAFVNWRIADEAGETLLRSTKGFSLFDNEYLTLEEKALINLAKNNGGSATVKAELRIVIHADKPETLDISKISLIK
jgi:hypothetical protein